MTCFCIFLQFLTCCLTPTLQHPVRFTPCQSNIVRKTFHNQPRQLTSQRQWESKSSGQQSNKGNSKYGRLGRKRKNKRRNTRPKFCPKRHGKASLLKGKERKTTKHIGCRKKLRRKRWKYKQTRISVKQNKRKSKKQRTQRNENFHTKNSQIARKVHLKKEQINIKNNRSKTGRTSVKKKTKIRCCKKRRLNICFKAEDKQCRRSKKKWKAKRKCCRRQKPIGLGEDLVERSSTTVDVGLDEINYLERLSFYLS